jgi:hypothetical protein
MTADPTELELEDHLRRQGRRLSARPDGAVLDDVLARAAHLGRRRRRRLAGASVTAAAAAAAALVAAVLVVPDDRPDLRTGTTDAPGTTTTPPPPPDDPTADEPGIVAPPLPFDALRRSAEDDRVTGDAMEALVTTCMADHGLADRPRPESTPHDPDARWPDTVITDRFGVFVEAEVHERGYAPPQLTAEHAARRQEAADAPTFTEQYGADVLVVWGICQSQAGEHLRGGPQDMASPDHPANLLGGLRGDATDAAEADGRVADVVAEWSACMAARGHHYAHPSEPVLAFSPQEREDAGLDPLTPSDAEVATGLDDVACKDEVGFTEVWYAVLAEREQAAIDAHPGEVAAARQWDADFVARARAVVAEG